MATALPLFATEALTNDLAELFLGRDKLIAAAVKTLRKPGQTCIIYGEPGIGKTSLAWQIIATLEAESQTFRPVIDKYSITSDEFTCVPIKGMAGPPRGVNELLIQAILPSLDPKSLSRRIPALYESRELSDHVRNTYNINLLRADDLLIYAKDNEYRELVERLYEDVVSFAITKGMCKNLIFFVDEANDMENKSGLGRMVKNTKFARFVFIGTGDTLDQILAEHQSAARKIIAGDIKVEPLTVNDITSIFTNAANRSEGRISFTDGFLNRIGRVSGGFPWIAQHVGDQAVDELPGPGAKSRIIGKKRFYEVFPIVKRTWRQGLVDYHVLRSKSAARCALALADASSPLTTVQIREKTRVGYENVVGALGELTKAGVIRRLPDGKHRFEDPIIRSFVLEELQPVTT